MSQQFDHRSGLMARLTISAVEKATKNPSCWQEPLVHKALLVSGLSVLSEASQLIKTDLDFSQR